MEEDEPDVPFVLQQQQQSTTPIIEELPSLPDNQDKALVLFKPIHQHLLVSPSTFSFTVDSDIVSGIKSKYPTFNFPSQYMAESLISSPNLIERSISSKFVLMFYILVNFIPGANFFQ